MRTNLRVFRVKNHLTQEEMAEKIGVSRLTYSRVELGKRGGDVEDFWTKLEVAFNVPHAEMYDLMKKDDEAAI